MEGEGATGRVHPAAGGHGLPDTLLVAHMSRARPPLPSPAPDSKLAEDACFAPAKRGADNQTVAGQSLSSSGRSGCFLHFCHFSAFCRFCTFLSSALRTLR